MTIYIVGSSSTVMHGGWADQFALKMVRRYAVRNSAISAASTLMSLIRMKQEAPYEPGDIVLWSGCVADATALTAGGFQDGSLLAYLEEMIRHVAECGATFLPILIDTWNADMNKDQRPYKDALLELFNHYGLAWVDITEEYERDTGLPEIPRHFFNATGHMHANSDMSRYIGDLAAEAVDAGLARLPEGDPVYVDPERKLMVVNRFDPDSAAELFKNRVVETTLWQPGVSLPPEGRPAGDLELEAVVFMAVPEGGAVDLSVGEETVTLSARCTVGAGNWQMMLAAYLPNMIGAPLSVPEGSTITTAWTSEAKTVEPDLMFHPEPGAGPSRARLAAMAFRPSA
ncbi:SGNH/GDSL hydrolase family protein [Dinoroseobacter sp. S124A]|uniref:SGNH/GDSL hydrolase family protein n=1 Tax=Dinoroseobacter sp. S124A TaxID=3415128 RepID=UPI003C7AECB2